MTEIWGDHPRGPDVAVEDATISVECVHTLLDPRSSRVLQSDDGSTNLHRHLHDLDDLVCDCFAEASSEDGEIFCEDEHGAAVDGSVSGDDGVTGWAFVLDAESACLVTHEHVGLLETVLVDQERDTLTGRELAEFMLAVDGSLGAGVLRLVSQLAKLFDILFGAHDEIPTFRIS